MKKVVNFIFVCAAILAFASCGASKAGCEAYTSEVITIEQDSDLAQK